MVARRRDVVGRGFESKVSAQPLGLIELYIHTAAQGEPVNMVNTGEYLKQMAPDSLSLSTVGFVSLIFDLHFNIHK